MAANFPPVPPWGYMDLGQDEFIAMRPVPKDWIGPPADWGAWLQTVIDVISADLWPVFVQGGQTWQSAHVEALFEADFRLLKILRLELDQPIRGAVQTRVLHREFFDLEDKDSTLFGTGYEAYEPMLGLGLRQRLISGMNAGIVRKMGSIDSQTKKVFQRPRPWQVAMMRNLEFTWRVARSAFTPSMISGHCISGVMAGCGAFEVLSKENSGMDMKYLQQFSVDIGDRRVMAGVHFPSDNLSSWYCAMRLIPRVFDPAVAFSVKQFLWGAIDSWSIVFQQIKEDIRVRSAGSPYAAIVERIKAEARI